jgi:tetratricopeptide (TPR) repeat protein
MVMAHELAHTFHVEQTQGRVPRWFTEGLAELETARHNYVWKREMSRDLYMALTERSLRGIATLNEAFSHAKNELEMVTAYIHATWVVRYLFLHHGWPGLRKMLELYTREMPTPEVITQVTGFTAAEFDRRFFAYLSAMFARFGSQFHPSAIKFADRERLTKDLDGGTADAFGRMALSHLLAAEKDDFRLVMDKARRLDAKNRWVLFAEALFAQSERNTTRALELLEELVRAGHDGFEIRQYLSFIYQLLNRRDDEIRQLEKAAAFDPENIQVRMRLAQHYRDTTQEAGFIRMLREVARRNEGDAGVVRKLVELGAKNRDDRLTAEFGLQLLDIAPFGQGEGTLQAASALFALGRPAAALPLLRVHRLENPEDRLGKVRLLLARSLVSAGRGKEAKPMLEQLVSLFPGMTEARELLRNIR